MIITNFAAFSGMGSPEGAPHFILNPRQATLSDGWHSLAASRELPQVILFMIDKNVVEKLVNQWLEDKDYFLVDIEISPDDRIVVEIDHADGVWIEDCVQLSRFIEDNLNRDDEDYELEVGSAGLGQPFKVRQQYLNFIGKEVEVLDADGKKWKGLLKSVDGDDFTITVKEKVKKEGAKRPVIEDVDKTFGMNTVKYTKYLISFK